MDIQPLYFKSNKFFNIVFVLSGLILIILAYIYWIPNYGVNDVTVYLRAMKVIGDVGFIEGYTLSGITDYPPLYGVIFYCANLINDNWNLEKFKIFVALIHCISTIAFYALSKRIVLTVLFGLATLISSVGLGYIDIFLAIPFFIFLCALAKNQYSLAALTFSIAFLIKWQPLIISPIILLYLYEVNSFGCLVKMMKKKIFWISFLIPIVFLAIIYLIFGSMMLSSFSNALAHSKIMLNPNGLNLPFTLSALINLIEERDLNALITLESHSHLWPWVKIPYMSMVALLLCVFYSKQKDLKSFLIFSIAIFWTYFVLSPGVHENHLFIALLLAFFLQHFAPSVLSCLLLILTILVFNLNLIFIYANRLPGIYEALNLTGIFAHKEYLLIASIYFSIFNLIAFIWFLIQIIRGSNNASFNLGVLAR